jgi:hypothetical protein
MSVSPEPRQQLELLRPTPDPCNMVARADAFRIWRQETCVHQAK